MGNQETLKGSEPPDPDSPEAYRTLYAQALHQQAQLRAVDEIVRALNAEHHLDAVLGLAARRAAELVGASGGFVLLPTEDGEHLEVAATHNSDGKVVKGLRVPIARSLNGYAFRLGTAVTSEDVARDPRADPRLREAVNFQHALVVPIARMGRVLGTFSVASPRGSRSGFSAEELSLLERLAGHLAIAIENARSHGALEERVEERTRALEAAQEQLVRRERLAILGRMAGGVSHEIRNPLGVLRNSLFFLRMVLGEHPDGDVRRQLEIMEQEVDRANRIVGDLLDYARVREPSLRPIDPVKALEKALAEAAPGPAVALRWELPPSVPWIQADPDQVHTILLNLLRNALQAMESRGTLTLGVIFGGEYTDLTVRDSGPGIPEAVRERLFEPLVTTKVKGLGLGLATARNLAEVQHGSLDALGPSPDGDGATFRLRLRAAVNPSQGG
ncbi:MAG: GAF domain-containing protein [Deltaproteobacteria bacterium]|nr:GAF domain-containing protein [Deltaproteobacteria bacterium]